MDGLNAFCPQCRQDVRFQQHGSLAVCPACGYAYQVATVPAPRVKRQPLTAIQIMLFLAWMFLPSFLALAFQKFVFDPKAGVQSWLPYGLLLTAANSLLATFWLAGRVSQNRLLAVVLGLFMACTVFGMNVTVVFLASCASLLAGGKL